MGEVRDVTGSEDCRRCGGPNVVWSAPSPLWNFVMRENDINNQGQFRDLVCMGCFIELAAEKGIERVWRLNVTPEPDGLVYETPSGRVWNPETWLWDDADAEVAHPLEVVRDAARAVASHLLEADVESGYRVRRSQAAEKCYFEWAWSVLLAVHDLGLDLPPPPSPPPPRPSPPRGQHHEREQ